MGFQLRAGEIVEKPDRENLKRPRKRVWQKGERQPGHLVSGGLVGGGGGANGPATRSLGTGG